MTINDIESLIKGPQNLNLKPKSILPNGLKPKQRKTLANTDQHDFNYKVTKDGTIKNDPMAAYGTKNRQLKGKIEKIDHQLATKKLNAILKKTEH